MIRWLRSLFEPTSEETLVTVEALQGKWKMVRIGSNGNFAPPTVTAAAKIYSTIEGNFYTVTTGGVVGDRGTIRLDTAQAPVHFDQLIAEGEGAGSTLLGIARMRDGLLENFQAEQGCERPKKFRNRWSDGASLAAFRRAKTSV